MRFKPNSAEIREEIQRENCSVDRAVQLATRKLLRKAASDIDTVSDCRRFLMALSEVLG
jgi:hypothetical protein